MLRVFDERVVLFFSAAKPGVARTHCLPSSKALLVLDEHTLRRHLSNVPHLAIYDEVVPKPWLVGKALLRDGGSFRAAWISRAPDV